MADNASYDTHSLQSFQDDSQAKKTPTKMSDRDPLINRSDKLTRSGEILDLQGETESFYDRFMRPCIAELIGVMLFVFIGTTAIGAITNTGSPSIVAFALAHGLTIALLVIATGSISGAHLNPAVTLGVAVAGAISPIQAIFYVLSQLVGSIIGAALTRGVLTEKAYTLVNGGAHTLPAGVTVGQCFLCEVVLTSLLVLTVLLVAVDPVSKSDLAPLAIGFAVVTDILAGGAVSGASMNPARSFGPAVVVSHFNTDIWSYHWIYWVGPALGALLAGIWYRFFLANPDKRIIRFS